MPAYVCAFVKATDPKFAEYPPLVQATLDPFDGRFIIKSMMAKPASEGGPAFAERSTAEDYTVGVSLEFPTLEKALEWKNSEAYQNIIKMRTDNSVGPLIICDGTGKVVEGGSGAYCLAFVKATDPKFGEYPPLVQATLDPFGGQFLAKSMMAKPASEGGPAFAERSTAEDYTVCVVIGFPSVEKLHQWHDSPDYQGIINMRLDNSIGPLIGCEAWVDPTSTPTLIER